MGEQRIWIRNGIILDPASDRDEVGDLLIEDVKIAATGPGLDVPEAHVIYAAGPVRQPLSEGFLVGAHAREGLAGGVRVSLAVGALEKDDRPVRGVLVEPGL